MFGRRGPQIDSIQESVEHHREIAAAIPGARLEVIADCGHMAQVEQPDAVTRLLDDWLEYEQSVSDEQ